MQTKILIKGAGEHASGTAHRLFRCGFHVVMTELECPRAVRRTVSFCSAVFDGEIVVEGVKGLRYTLEQAGFLASFDWTHLPVFVDPQGRLRELWKPEVIIDGRILKKNLDNSIDHAPLVIGYGPGLTAGTDVHYVVETNRGHSLGRIVARGQATEDTGIPGSIGGYTAPTSGTLLARRDIGDPVKAGDLIGTVGSRKISAPISGVVRGLVLPGSEVTTGQKLGDIDPRGDPTFCYTLSDKTRTISGAALEIIISFLNRR